MLCTFMDQTSHLLTVPARILLIPLPNMTVESTKDRQMFHTKIYLQAEEEPLVAVTSFQISKVSMSASETS